MTVTQTARETFDLLTRDLRALYYLPPTAYNQTLINRIQFSRFTKLSQRMAAQQKGLAGAESDEEKEEPLIGLPIDLTIIGSDKEGGDSLTFVTYQMDLGTIPMEPWALARVKYWVEGGNVFRAEGPVTVEKIPRCQSDLIAQISPPFGPKPARAEAEAKEPEQPQSAEDYLKGVPRELVARNVRAFDLGFGYWTDEGWKEASDWVAHERRYRNPPFDIGPEDPSFALIAGWNRSRPSDGIPAYVTVTLALGYGKDSAKTRAFRTRIRLMNSTETYEPFLAAFALSSTPYSMPAARPPFRR
ncbi:hypothetical protein FJY63_05800, partial [Candidatus Sumerlaeota bacterium]|nr:hypothetical protein [Candidatus Sumerlaeota bacterium]